MIISCSPRREHKPACDTPSGGWQVGGFIVGSWLNDTLLSYLTQKSGTHHPSHSLGVRPRDSENSTAEIQHAAGKTLQSYAPLIQTAPFMHQNPSSHFPSPQHRDHIAVCFQRSAYLCSDSIYEPTRVYWHGTEFPLFFLDRIVCGEMSDEFQ